MDCPFLSTSPCGELQESGRNVYSRVGPFSSNGAHSYLGVLLISPTSDLRAILRSRKAALDGAYSQGSAPYPSPTRGAPSLPSSGNTRWAKRRRLAAPTAGLRRGAPRARPGGRGKFGPFLGVRREDPPAAPTGRIQSVVCWEEGAGAKQGRPAGDQTQKEGPGDWGVCSSVDEESLRGKPGSKNSDRGPTPL